MIGIFLKNKEGKLCFAQPPQDPMPQISAFHYFKDTYKIAIVLASGEERVLDTTIAAELRPAFLEEKNVLVVDLDEKSEFKGEYKVPLIV